MANTFLTPAIIAREAMMQLRANCVMAGLVHRDYASEFVSGVGDTVTIRKPASLRRRSSTATAASPSRAPRKTAWM